MESFNKFGKTLFCTLHGLESNEFFYSLTVWALYLSGLKATSFDDMQPSELSFQPYILRQG